VQQSAQPSKAGRSAPAEVMLGLAPCPKGQTPGISRSARCRFQRRDGVKAKQAKATSGKEV